MARYSDHGRILQRFRICAGLTQVRVSELTGIPIGTLQQYEQGRCMPSAHRELQLMILLKIPSAQVLTQDITDPERIMV